MKTKNNYRPRILVGNGSHQAIGHFRGKIYGNEYADYRVVLPVGIKYPNKRSQVYLTFAYPHLRTVALKTIEEGTEYWIRGYPMVNQDGDIYEIRMTAWTPVNNISTSFMDYAKINPYLFYGLNEDEPMKERIVLTGKLVKNTIEVQESIYQKSNLETYKKTGFLPKRKYKFIDTLEESSRINRSYCHTFILYRGSTMQNATKLFLVDALATSSTRYPTGKRRFTRDTNKRKSFGIHR